MKKLAMIALAALFSLTITACHKDNSTAPTEVYTGTYVGTLIVNGQKNENVVVDVSKSDVNYLLKIVDPLAEDSYIIVALKSDKTFDIPVGTVVEDYSVTSGGGNFATENQLVFSFIGNDGYGDIVNASYTGRKS